MDEFAKAVISNADGICDAIDLYLAKADDDLKDTLDAEGFAEPDHTVSVANSFEEQIAESLENQTAELLSTLDDAEKDNVDADELKARVATLLAADTIQFDVADTAEKMYEVEIPNLASIYMEQSDGELVVEALRSRTSNWIQSWSGQLGELMRVSTHQQMTSLIENSISDGSSIADLTRKIREGGWRNEYYQAKRVAVTEVLRAHSVAREESIQQSPACDEKEWRHTGAHKNQPRPNHVAMDGQIVPKSDPFVLIGRDGNTYYPMYPRDSILPASESVNCHCIHRGVPNKDVLGLSLEERKALQEEALQSDNGEWAKEANKKNRAKAGIEEYEESVERPISHTNTKAADSWAKSHLGVSKTNYTKQDIKSVNKVNRAMQRIYKEYPELEGFIDEIEFTDKINDVASAKIIKKGDQIRTKLRLSTTYFADTKAIDKMISQQVAAGTWSPKKGVYGILKHEMTHMMSYQKAINGASSVDEAWQSIKNMDFCESIKAEALKACKLTDDGGIIQKKLGLQATKNADEFVAEAVSSSRKNKLAKVTTELFNSR
ncbi:MAG: phage minor head protein [Hespellia sp.]|nr:phage minor head protein [Hespellia sp.]